MRRTLLLPICLLVLLFGTLSSGFGSSAQKLESAFQNPPREAKPWVFWYWLNASVSKEGIAADLKAMKEIGLGGAYLVPIRGASTPPLIEPVVEQFTPLWWDHVLFALREADRLGISIAMHASDGFATAGGPWIKPEASMQKIVWTKTKLAGGGPRTLKLPQPETNLGYYRDIAVYAYRSTNQEAELPQVTSSLPGSSVQFLVNPGERTLKTENACSLSFTYARPFTCRAITIRTPRTKGIQSNTYRANRFTVEASDDGQHFRQIASCEPPRHGWQDGDADTTHAIPATTAKVFRLNFDPSKAEAAAEDLDSTKWKASLTLQGVTLSEEPTLHHFEGKTAHVWRVSPATPASLVSGVPASELREISSGLSADCSLAWDAPEGNWTILRIGCTTTGYQNDSAGAGKGLESDKMNPEVTREVFDRWFAEVIRRAGPELSGRVLKVFHVDSWECGSQNWSPDLLNEFKRRRGYDPRPFLPALAGVPVRSAEEAEAFLRDYRETISELIVDNFFAVLHKLAAEKGCLFSAESVAPVMSSDGIEPNREVDIPMGEFWLRSPTHDKPNDVLDGVAGAHLYGKRIAQMEAFTEIRMLWDETPTLLKPVGERNYAMGANRFLMHVFAQNPWMDRKPGMTMGGCGLYFQRDQTWWKPGRAWIQYQERCSAVLMEGLPVNDLAIYAGDNIPRRAVLPWHLANTFPDEFPVDDPRRKGKFMEGQDWVDPLNGFGYDSINRDALLRLASVKNGRIVLPGGASYAALVIPASNPMMPEASALRADTLAKLMSLAEAGATIVFSERPVHLPTAVQGKEPKPLAPLPDLQQTMGSTRKHGVGRIHLGPLTRASLDSLSLRRDFQARDAKGQPLQGLAWTHRQGGDWDLYLVGNQKDQAIDLEALFRVDGRRPEFWDPVTGDRRPARTWTSQAGVTKVPLHLEARQSLFVVFRKAAAGSSENQGSNTVRLTERQLLSGPWQLSFDPAFGGPQAPVSLAELRSWTSYAEEGIRHYSGTATYSHTFNWEHKLEPGKRIWLELGRVAELADITLNGKACGVAWTPPYRVEITGALQAGANTLSIEVTNTWFNRLAGDRSKPEKERLTRTTAPERTEGRPLMESGLLGPVRISEE